MGKPRNTRKYPTYPRYPEIPESKKGTRKYPIVFFDTPTRPEPDPLPGILSNTRPDPILKKPYLLGTAYLVKTKMKEGGLSPRFSNIIFLLKLS